MQTEEFHGHSSEMRTSPWLASEDIVDFGDVRVTIEEVFHHIDAVMDAGRRESFWAIKFRGSEKQLILNNTNRGTLVRNLGTGDTKQWRGKVCTLYVDMGVKKYGGRVGDDLGDQDPKGQVMDDSFVPLEKALGRCKREVDELRRNRISLFEWDAAVMAVLDDIGRYVALWKKEPYEPRKRD